MTNYNLTNLTETLMRGMNNPDCSFFVGAFTGRLLTAQTIGAIILISMFYKGLEIFVFTPLFNYIKNRWFK